ncbi:DUF29 domain-containing protein [Chelatococcus sambhunathii]|uniref:DUF29 domain-containing protein n=1 Tax=Chelatococcus sambhunathii TaxID=363953 RepID=A0ABU1DK79_9HYPH|nr:DUF29 domain-containing protein [Chelatococcus sambhunathii]MDR4308481.1 DUF29 domain-containing protein [Chelatococcus sambhunathii]
MAEVKERPRAGVAAGYDDDFYHWANHQAALLRQGRFAELDLSHLIEEIEDMGSEKRRALESSYRLLIFHLLKWRHQPTRRSRSWALTIVRERGNIEDLSIENPSLAAASEKLVEKVYDRARRETATETGLELETFPETCPFTLAQLRDDEFLPD